MKGLRGVLISLGLSVGLIACASLYLPAEDARKIADCQEVGRKCKADGGTGCYGEYDACMRDGGLR